MSLWHVEFPLMGSQDKLLAKMADSFLILDTKWIHPFHCYCKTTLSRREELQLEFFLISLQEESKHVLIINNVHPHSVGPRITSLFVALSTSTCNCFLGGSSLPLPSCHTLIDSPP